MSMFSGLKTDGLEKTEDRLGGFQIHPTNAYLGTIKMAYAGKSAGGAHNITVVADIGVGEYSETIYITNKQGENFFLNRQDNTKKVPLPGFTTINDLCLVTTNKPLSEQDTEEKVVKIYDYDERKELPKSVQMLVDLIGKTAYFGITENTEDKNQKNESTGEYEPTGETRQTNTIDKIFHDPTKMTVVEAENEATEAIFFDKWVEKNKGQVKDKRKNKGGAPQSGRPGQTGGGAPQSGAGGAKKTGSLFGGNK